MKTLKEHQDANPGYDVWSDSRPCDPDTELLKDGKWSVCNFVDGSLPYWDVNGVSLSSETLCKVGAIFRRKKERQREFKIEAFPWGNESTYVIDGKHYANFYNFARNEGIKSATLRVDEWGDE